MTMNTTLANALAARSTMTSQQRLATDHLRWLNELHAKTGTVPACEIGAAIALCQAARPSTLNPQLSTKN